MRRHEPTAIHSEARVDQDAVAIRKDLEAGDAGYRSAGEKFLRKKGKMPHGAFLPWLEAEGFSQPTASRCMRFAKYSGMNTFNDWLIEQEKSRKGNEMDVHYSSETDEWATPQELFDLLDSEFHFTLDVCASKDNAKCTTFYTQDDDGLSKPWTGTCWMNPPYGDAIAAWVDMARAAADDGATVVCLLPARVDTAWWWDNARYGEVRFLRGRLKFGGAESGAPFPSAVVIFRGNEPSVTWWEAWPKS